MKQSIAVAIVGAVILAIAGPVFADEKSTGGKTVTVTGQVVDLACFLSQGAHGASHKACATACAKAGGALGILTKDGNVIVSIEPGPGKDPNKLLMPYVEQNVTATGTEFNTHGITSMAVSSVKSNDTTTRK